MKLVDGRSLNLHLYKFSSMYERYSINLVEIHVFLKKSLHQVNVVDTTRAHLVDVLHAAVCHRNMIFLGNISLEKK